VPSESLPAERKGSSEAARAAAPARRRRSSGSSRIWVGVGGDPLPARTDEGGGLGGGFLFRCVGAQEHFSQLEVGGGRNSAGE
jgi:hypothetical protein